VPGTWVVEDFNAGSGVVHLSGDGVNPRLTTEGVVDGVVNLCGHGVRPRSDADHCQVEGAREHQDTTNRPPRGHELSHPTAVGEPRGDEPVGHAGHGFLGDPHQRRVAHRFCELAGLLIVVEDAAVVLIHDHDVVAFSAEAIGGFADARTHPQNRVEQRDVGHGHSLPADTDKAPA